MVPAGVPLEGGPIMVESPQKHIRDKSGSKGFASSTGKGRTRLGGEGGSSPGQWSWEQPSTCDHASPDGMSSLAWVGLFITINSSKRHNKPEEIKVA